MQGSGQTKEIFSSLCVRIGVSFRLRVQLGPYSIQGDLTRTLRDLREGTKNK